MSGNNIVRTAVDEENFIEKLATAIVEKTGPGSGPERIRKLYHVSMEISAALGRKMVNIARESGPNV